MRQTTDFEDKILDNLLSDSMDDLYPDFEDLICDNDPEPSEHFQQSMETIFQAEHRKLKQKTFHKYLSRIAAVFALFLIVGFVTINTTSAWKEPLYNFFFHPADDHNKTKVEFTDPEEEADRYLPGYVPEGFELVEKSYNKETDQYHMHYERNNLYLIIFVVKNKSDLYVDLTTFDKVKHNNMTYFTNNMDSLVWNYNNYYFFITSNLTQSEIFKISDSIK